MSKSVFALIGFLSFFSLTVWGQSVKIIPNRVTYTRPKPTSDFKKIFSVTYPKVKGVAPGLARKIEDSISYRKVLLFKPENEFGEYQWLEEAEYEVGYNRKGILNIYLTLSGTAAYPTSFGKYAVVDLKTGHRVTAKDVFTNPGGLLNKIRKLQREEIAESIKEIKTERADYGDVNTDELFKYVNFQKTHLEDFSVDESGVTFHYRYGFPRILYPLEPGGSYFLSWANMKPFIKRGGLFEKFCR